MIDRKNRFVSPCADLCEAFVPGMAYFHLCLTSDALFGIVAGYRGGNYEKQKKQTKSSATKGSLRVAETE